MCVPFVCYKKFGNYVVLFCKSDDKGTKLFVVMAVMNSKHGKISKMFFWQVLKGTCEMEWINGELLKVKH